MIDFASSDFPKLSFDLFDGWRNYRADTGDFVPRFAIRRTRHVPANFRLEFLERPTDGVSASVRDCERAPFDLCVR